MERIRERIFIFRTTQENLLADGLEEDVILII